MEMDTETMASGSVYVVMSMLMLLHDDDVAHDDDDDDDDDDKLRCALGCMGHAPYA
jgi:hypothetical protein